MPRSLANPPDDAPRWTRREAMYLAAGSALGVLASFAKAGEPNRPEGARPWWMRQHHPRSPVVDVRSDQVVRSGVTDRAVLDQLLTQGLLALTRATSATTAWRRVLGDARRIVLKFNAVGADVINNTDAMAETLLTQLSSAGYSLEDVVVVEASPHLVGRFGARTAAAGWGASIRVGDGEEPLAQYVLDADAIVNVPFLKTHRIAGMSGCMKNLSHAVIQHPARYHANGCSPFVGQVIGATPVHSRLRLNVVNALRVVIDRGPEAREEDISEYGGLLLGYDPVAVDAIGLELLVAERRRAGRPGAISVPHIAAAAESGVGRSLPQEIERRSLDVEG